MIDLPVLETYRDSEPLELSDEDVLFITERLAKRISIERPPRGPGYILNSQQFACVIVLPSGRLLRSRPRMRTRNLFIMLAYAYGLPPEVMEDAAPFEDLDHLLEFVADYWAGLVESRLERGLYRAYVEQEENLAVVRGRISFVEDVRRNAVMRQRTYCRYTELLWDVPENQVLRFVARTLSGWDFSEITRDRLANIDHRMDEVSRPRFVPSDLDRLQYHRLNADYEPMHQLCRLFLEEMSLSEESGEHELNGFILDMNALFERFVTEVLRRLAPPGWGVSDQEESHLGWRRLHGNDTYRRAIQIRPDLVLRRKRVVQAVLDCKYKQTSSTSFKQHDFYQVLSYCTALGTSLGALIYPKSELPLADHDVTLISRSPIAIRRFGVDLSVESEERLPSEIAAFAEDVFSWASGDELTLEASRVGSTFAAVT